MYASIFLCLFVTIWASPSAFAQKSTDGDSPAEAKKEFDRASGRGQWLHDKLAGPDSTVDISQLLIHDVETFKALNNSAVFKQESTPAWEPVGGAQDGRVSGRGSDIAFDPTDENTFYLAEPQGGLWKTTNHGTSWTYLSQTWASNGMGAVAVDPNNHLTIYAATGDIEVQEWPLGGCGMYKSTDGGLNWTLVATTSQVGSLSHQVLVDPSNSNVVYASGSSGIAKSTDAGATWVYALGQGGVTEMVIDPTNSQHLIECCSNGTMKNSMDGGATWKAVSGLSSGSFGRGSLAMSQSNPLMVYASLNGGNTGSELAVSSDGGNSWRVTITNKDWLGQQGWYANAITVNPNNQNLVVTGGLDIWRSEDAGSTIQQLTDWTTSSNATDYSHADIHRLKYNKDGLYALTDGGIYFSNSDGKTWQQGLNTGLSTLQFVGLDATSDGSIIIGGAQDNGVNAVNMGSTSTTKFLGIAPGDGGNTYVSQTDGQAVYSTHYSQVGDVSLIKSIDGGSSWLYQGSNIVTNDSINNESLPFYINYTVCESDPSSVVIAGTQYVWYSNDGGADFNSISPAGLINPARYAVHIAPADASTIYAASSNSKIFCSYQGNPWKACKTTLGPVNCIQTDPSDPTRVFAVTASGASRFWISTDTGTTFQHPATNFPSVTGLGVAYDPSTGYIYASTDAGVLGSGDTGKTWVPLMNGLPSLMIMSIHVRGHYLVVGTYGRGAFRMDLSNLTLAAAGVASNVIPSNGLLLGNVYPNPVSTSANPTVSFTMPKAGLARLSIYDELGREVRVAENANLTAGTYTRSLDLSNLSGGTYYYALTALGRTLSHSLVIVR
jgi:hypothetical protein